MKLLIKNGVAINLSILDFKYWGEWKVMDLEKAINLSILDFKF